MAKQRRQSKAAGRVLRALKLLRGAENVPDNSFEAQQKQLVGPRKCQITFSKPNRNSSWGLGRSHGKAAKGRRRLLRGF